MKEEGRDRERKKRERGDGVGIEREGGIERVGGKGKESG